VRLPDSVRAGFRPFLNPENPVTPNNPTRRPTLTTPTIGTIRIVVLHLVLLIAPQAVASFPPLAPDDIVFWSKSGSKDYFVPPGVGTLPSENLGDQAQQ